MASIGWMMSSINRYRNLYMSDHLSDPTLTHASCQILLILKRNPGCNQEETANILCLDKSRIARCLATLETNGYIVRTPGADKRELIPSLTERGENMVEEIKELYRQWNLLIAQGSSESEIQAMQATLEKILNRAKSYAQSREEKQ